MALCRAKADPLAKWDALMRKVEVPFSAEVEAEKNRYIEDAAGAFPITRQLSPSGFERHQNAMTAIAARYDGIAIRLALGEVSKGLKQQRDGWDALWLYLLRLWIQQHGAQRARETAETTRDDLQRVINVALAADVEFNPVEVATAMLKVRDLSAWRAETIARTEVHAAMMFASEEGSAKLARDNGLTLLKSWLPVQDERTRANHSAMSSHPAIPLDADFNVGGTPMKRPGDPRGGAANCINCRCVLTFKEQE